MKIAAVIVTYNRLSLLQNVLLGIADQSRPVESIIIINNGSTDGTAEWLATQHHLLVITQENEGGAAGFSRGLAYAKAQGFTHAWIMDDDGFPAQDCLGQLVNSSAIKLLGDNVVTGSLVLNKDDHSRLAFSIPDLSSRYYKLFDHYTKQTDDVERLQKLSDNLGYPWGLFFNSVLIPLNIIEKAGLPKKEFFIWGDEVEYFNRVRKEGFKTYLILTSLFYHPKAAAGSPAKWKEKYRARNYAYINRKYKPVPTVHYVKELITILYKRKFYLIRPFIHGLTGNFRHRY